MKYGFCRWTAGPLGQDVFRVRRSGPYFTTHCTCRRGTTSLTVTSPLRQSSLSKKWTAKSGRDCLGHAMSRGGMGRTHSTRRLRIPVRFVDSRWECTWGGVLPVKIGTEAELFVERSAIADKAFLETIERKGRHKVLGEGTTLLAATVGKIKRIKVAAKSESPCGQYMGRLPCERLSPSIAAPFGSG